MTEIHLKVEDANQIKVLSLSGASALLVGYGNKVSVIAGAPFPEGTPNIPIIAVYDIDDIRAVDLEDMRKAGFMPIPQGDS